MQKNKFNIGDTVYCIDWNHYCVWPSMIVKAERSEWAEYQNQWAKKVEEMKWWEQFCINYEVRVQTLWGMAKWVFREEDIFETEKDGLEYLANHAQGIIDALNKLKEEWQTWA